MNANLLLAILTGKIVQVGPTAFVINHGYSNAEFVMYIPTKLGAYKIVMGMN